jgi:hypothetical protein
VRREVWRGSPWMATTVVVVADEPGLLATYLPEGAEFVFADGHGLGPHPWVGRPAWQGHGVLMLQRPGESYAVWHFWDGERRDFAGWYLNLQEPFRRTAAGYDTQDLELDVWVPAGGPWTFKDDELLDVRVREGRFTHVEAAAIRTLGAEIGAMLDVGEEWWDEEWSRWRPDPAWRAPRPPHGWERAAA